MHGSRLWRPTSCAPEVLLDRHREVRASLDGGVVGHDDALTSPHPADPGDDPGPGRLVVVEAVGGQRRQLEERRTGVEQHADAVPGQQLAPLGVAGPRRFRTAGRDLRQVSSQIGGQGPVGLDVDGERLAGRVGARHQDGPGVDRSCHRRMMVATGPRPATRRARMVPCRSPPPPGYPVPLVSIIAGAAIAQ